MLQMQPGQTPILDARRGGLGGTYCGYLNDLSGCCGALRNRPRIRLDLLLQFLRCRPQLRVLAAELSWGKLSTTTSGSTPWPSISHLPSAYTPGLRGRGDSVIGLPVVEAQPDFAAPRPRTDDLAQLQPAESLTERLAIRRGVGSHSTTMWPRNAYCMFHVGLPTRG